jgi:hypothetical protein
MASLQIGTSQNVQINLLSAGQKEGNESSDQNTSESNKGIFAKLTEPKEFSTREDSAVSQKNKVCWIFNAFYIAIVFLTDVFRYDSYRSAVLE